MESITSVKHRAAEFTHKAFTIINSVENLDVATLYYLQALEKVGRLKILKENLGHEIA